MSDVTAKTSVGSASNSDVAYVSMSDESELSRMMAMQPGIGDAIFLSSLAHEIKKQTGKFVGIVWLGEDGF